MKTSKKVPVVLQMEETECGAASLCMILGYYGRYIDLSEMRNVCRVSRDGSTVKNIMDAAGIYGMEAKAYRTAAKNLSRMTLPAIIFWKDAHFVVLESIDDKNVWICDPSSGRQKLSRAYFNENYSRVVITLTPGETFVPGGRPYSSVRLLMSSLKNAKTVLIYLSAIYLLANMAGMMLPRMLTIYVDFLLPASGKTNIRGFFLIYGGIILLQLLILLVQKAIILKFDQAAAEEAYSHIFTKLSRLPLTFFQTRSHTTILSRICAVDGLALYVSSSLIPLCLGLICSVIYLGLLFYYSILMGAVITILILIAAVMMVLISQKSNTIIICAESAKNLLYGNAIESIRLFDTLKASSLEEMAITNTINAYIDYENQLSDAKKYASLMDTFPGMIPLLIQVITIGIGIALVATGQSTLGIILACQSLGMSVFSPISSFVLGFNSFKQMDVNIRGLYDIHCAEADPIATRCREGKAARTYSSVTMKNVAFGYNPDQEPVVKNISFTAEKGKRLAIVGGSGAGKSTLLSLLEGLYIPQSGKILYDEVPLAETDRTDLNRSLAIVSQVTQMFTGTIRDNITVFDDSIPEEAVIAALKDACLYEDIMQRSQGMTEMIDRDNCRFSGGQLQRMAIARALVKDPQILIMDEATSALDTVVEEKLMQNIRAREITMIIVAHRLSTIIDSDEILVLEGGEIVERGTHEALIQQPDSVYHKLVMADGQCGNV